MPWECLQCGCINTDQIVGFDDTLREGQEVESRAEGSEIWHICKITKDRNDGTYDIEFEDGRSEQRVKEDLIRALESKAPKKPQCEKCNLDKFIATTMQVVKMLNCEECGHRHRRGKYCHVFAEAGDDAAAKMDEEDGEDGGREDGEDEDDEEDSLLGRANKKSEADEGMNMLPTPKYVKDIRYARCNCDVGVPENSGRFEPCPRRLYCGDIIVLTYDEIMNPKMEEKDDEGDSDDEKVYYGRKEREKQKLAVILPLVMRFVPLAQVSHSAKVNSRWYYGVSAFRDYVDMRDAIPWQVYRPHMGQVESVVLVGHRLFSGGDRRVIGSDILTGELLGQITRDSGKVIIKCNKKFFTHIGLRPLLHSSRHKSAL